MRLKPEDTVKCLGKILATEYKSYAMRFLKELLEGKEYVSVKARVVGSGPKQESLLEFSHKILTPSMSTSAQETTKAIWDNDEFAIAEELENPKVKELREYSKDRLLLGAIYLIGVILIYSAFSILKNN